MFYSKENLKLPCIQFYIIRGEKHDSPSTHLKKSKPVSCPSHDDIWTVTQQSENIIKYKILTEKENIGKDFSFPQEQFGTKTSGKPHVRSFSLKWLEEFGQDGFCYSVYEDAAYYKFCRLFPDGERGLLVEKPFQKWKDAICDFSADFHNILSHKTKGYCGNKLHLSVITRVTEFVKCMEGENLPIIQVMDETSRKKIKETKRKKRQKQGKKRKRNFSL